VSESSPVPRAGTTGGGPAPPAEALLLVDAQMAQLGGPRPVPAAAEVLGRLRATLSAARAAGALVVHLQQDGAPGAPDEPGTPGWALHPDVAPVSGEPVIRKATDDGFAGTALGAILEGAGVRRIAVAGFLSEMCVSANVRAALSRGLQVVLVRDAHATYPVDDIPAAVVSRVAEHALGDKVELVPAAGVRFMAPSP
jgi:streptothricin hydrolase